MERKQSWLNNDDDLKELYEVCRKVKLLHILCYLPAADRGATAPNLNGSSQSRRSKIKAANEVKADEAKTILEKLKIKHGDKYTPEQFQNWSDLIQLKKCTDDEPPDLPFFRGCKKKAANSPVVRDASTLASTSSSSPVFSPLSA